MNREEYKINLKAYLLLNNMTIPDNVRWIAIDCDREVGFYSEEPSPNHVNSVWLVRRRLSSNHHFFSYNGHVAFIVGFLESLISIEELFDD